MEMRWGLPCSVPHESSFYCGREVKGDIGEEMEGAEARHSKGRIPERGDIYGSFEE